jgi:hypothetical protein
MERPLVDINRSHFAEVNAPGVSVPAPSERVSPEIDRGAWLELDGESSTDRNAGQEQVAIHCLLHRLPVLEVNGVLAGVDVQLGSAE